jgi:transketolase
MGSICNGIALYGNFLSFDSTFVSFSNYMFPSLRMRAMMNIPALSIFTHDSINIGEDGPTHQPVEHAAMLRSIPNCNVINPCDPNETAFSFRLSYETTKNPVVITTTRQKVATLENTSYEGFKHGAYVIYKEKGLLDGVIIAAGSEVSLAIDVAKKLEEEGKFVRVVSMPSMFLFDKQSKEYKEEIIPSNVKSMAIEMSHSMPWYKYSKNVYGVDTFGISAPAKDVLVELGFTVEKVLEYYKGI